MTPLYMSSSVYKMQIPLLIWHGLWTPGQYLTLSELLLPQLYTEPQSVPVCRSVKTQFATQNKGEATWERRALPPVGFKQVESRWSPVLQDQACRYLFEEVEGVMVPLGPSASLL